MGVYYDAESKRKTSKSTWTYGQGVEDEEEKLRKLLEIASAKGVETPDLEDKPSLFNRLMGLLNLSETAPAVYKYQQTGDIKEAFKTFGSQTLKRGTGQGLKPESPTYEDVFKKAGFGEGPKAKLPIVGEVSGRQVAGLAADITLDPSNLVLGGILKGAGKVAKPLSKGGGKVLTKVAPKTAAKIGKGIESFEDLFSATKKFTRIGDTGEEFVGKYHKFLKGTRGEQREAVERWLELSQKGTKLSKDVNEKMLKFLESNVADDVGDVGVTIKGWYKEMAKGEKARGLLDKEIPDYLFHSTTKEAREAGVDYMGTLNKALKARKGKERTVEGVVKEINEWSMKKHGFKMFEENVFKAGALREIDSVSKIRTYDFLQGVQKDFGIKGTKPLVIDGVKHIPFKPEIPGGEAFLLPEVIAKELKGVNKVLGNDEATNSLLKMYDKALRTWKISVTGWFPAFHGRNMMGGMFNNMVAGVKNPLRYLQADKFAKATDDVVKLAGKDWTYKQLNDMARQFGAIGDQGYFDVLGKVEDVAERGFKKGMGKVGELPRQAMNFTEDRLRGALLIDRLAKGDAFEAAVKQTWKFHFDYSPEALAPFEREVMKRVIPFYTWTRNNIPLQFEMMLTKRGLINPHAAAGKFLRSVSGRTPEERAEIEILPEYMQKGFPIKTGEKEGLAQYLYGMGLPMEDVNKLTAAQLGSMISPALKVPLELATNKHFFFDKPLSEVTTAPKLLDKAPKVVKDLVGYTPGKEGRRGKVDPKRWHIVSSLIGRGYYTVEKLSDPEVQNEIKILYFLLGIKGKDIDITQQKYYKTKDKYKDLGKFLHGKGAVRKVPDIYYSPKEK